MPPPYSEFVVPALGGVRWWSVFLTVGVLVGAWVAAREAQRSGLESAAAVPLLVVVVVAGLIGARAWYVVFEWERRFAATPELIPQIWQGGLALHGALIGGGLALTAHGLIARLSVLCWADAAAVGLPLGQAIGRWGDYFNQQSLGEPTDLPWALTVDSVHRPDGLAGVWTYHPAFLYESVWNLVVFAILLLVSRRGVWRRPGDLVLLYLVAYSAGRIPIEALRLDPLLVGNDWRLSLLVSVGLIAIAGLLFDGRRSPRRAIATRAWRAFWPFGATPAE